MDSTALQHIITVIKDYWFLWCILALSLIAFFKPRWLWSDDSESWMFRDGAKPEPSGAWLLRTRFFGILGSAITIILLRYGTPVH